GENYIYPMNGLAIKGTEGNLRSVSDQNWRVVGIGDFDGDGKADILWRNFSTGENYIYCMNNTTIVREGYIRTVSDLNWQVVAVIVPSPARAPPTSSAVLRTQARTTSTR